MAFTQEEEDYLREFINEKKLAKQINDVVTEKNSKVVELNAVLESQLNQTIIDAKEANDIAVKALAKTYDDQLDILKKK